MMNEKEREVALHQMEKTSSNFYASAVQIGNHPFIEFAGVMNEYIKACWAAHQRGEDFSEYSTHTGKHLRLEPFRIDYINEKLECIFTGRSVITDDVIVRCDCNWKLTIRRENLDEVSAGVWGTIPCQACGVRLNEKIKTAADVERRA